ncbi:MAG: hypothetical protein JWN66_4659 [Sphingomonas bacterium]|jgi:hypothetical protein|uniref:DUF6894 family protein n=1 Tax=Sphingomonas bacterium TaxID=1895847 RepID=UPI002635A66C|nr:hypothetical protein [Sphingomonas bacterium]MDB5707543.1 hypothetical protein [Sphingomonas bacterium]
MPRFFLHMVNDEMSTVDEEGMDLPDLKAACDYARETLGAIIGDELRGGRNLIHLSIMIDDDSRARVANIKAVTNVVMSTSPFSA